MFWGAAGLPEMSSKLKSFKSVLGPWMLETSLSHWFFFNRLWQCNCFCWIHPPLLMESALLWSPVRSNSEERIPIGSCALRTIPSNTSYNFRRCTDCKEFSSHFPSFCSSLSIFFLILKTATTFFSPVYDSFQMKRARLFSFFPFVLSFLLFFCYKWTHIKYIYTCFWEDWFLSAKIWIMCIIFY